MARSELKAKFWNQFADRKRIKQAATTPFHSIHLASKDNGTSAVTAVQKALIQIQLNSPQLVASFFFLPDLEVSRQWGPFDLADAELDQDDFGTSTDQAVQKFQAQADLDVDGKVGLDTLGKMDDMLAFLEIPFTPPDPRLRF
jgi:peptidoglycan hydrolase-like protein with peptidoglycan-binding domain